MSSSKGFRTSDASDKPDGGDTYLSLKTVQKMLPLVQRIVDDIVARRKALDRLQPEEEALDRKRRTLDWPARMRRYQLKDELAKADGELQGAMGELRELGLVLLHEGQGRVGFPTLVNNRKAYFCWHPGEDGLHSWQFADESATRPIPLAWLKELNLTGKS